MENCLGKIQEKAYGGWHPTPPSLYVRWLMTLYFAMSGNLLAQWLKNQDMCAVCLGFDSSVRDITKYSLPIT